jgi:hypothetical protein
LITDVERGEGSLGGVGGDNAVVGREPAREVALIAVRISRSLLTASSTR